MGDKLSVRLGKYATILQQTINKYTDLLIKSQQKRGKVSNSFSKKINRLRRKMLISQANSMQECAYLDDLRLENSIEMYRACIIVLKIKRAHTSAAIDEANAMGRVNIDSTFFVPVKSLCSSNPELNRLQKRRA